MWWVNMQLYYILHFIFSAVEILSHLEFVLCTLEFFQEATECNSVHYLTVINNKTNAATQSKLIQICS